MTRQERRRNGRSDNRARLEREACSRGAECLTRIRVYCDACRRGPRRVRMTVEGDLVVVDEFGVHNFAEPCPIDACPHGWPHKISDRGTLDDVIAHVDLEWATKHAVDSSDASGEADDTYCPCGVLMEDSELEYDREPDEETGQADCVPSLRLLVCRRCDGYASSLDGEAVLDTILAAGEATRERYRYRPLRPAEGSQR